jgi:hypothetical protein
MEFLPYSPQVPQAELRPSLLVERGRASLRGRGEYVDEYDNNLFHALTSDVKQ